MPFVSFAPNCEDVPLWRALCDVDQGRYIDWGPQPANGASFTRAFYERGWSGIAVRPTAEDAASQAELQPRDRTATAGEPLELEGVLHFMRADGVALSALELPALRPWIVVVPSEDGAAETALSRAGYRSVLFDGLSRFHLSPDHGELAARLAAPANASDDFVRAQDATVAARLAATQRALEAAEARLEGSQRRALATLRSAGRAQAEAARERDWLRGLLEHRATEATARMEEIAWLRDCLHRGELEGERLDGEVRELTRRANLLESQFRRADAEAAAARTSLELLHASRSWRLTAPLRRIRGGATSATPAALPALASTVDIADVADLSASVSQVPQPPLWPAVPAAWKPAPMQVMPVESVPDTCPPAPAHSQPGPSQPSPSQPGPSQLGPSQLGPSQRGAPLAAVHQFHAGSALGDAITNAMLLIRTRLRAAGFRSDIFVETRGDGLEEELRLLDELPDHPGYVLLLHHSMGYGSFASVLALPAPKVLVYHNITPAEYFEDPGMRQQVALGHGQLASLRDHVAHALADSAFNAFELHRLGFAAVRTCTLLFDTAAMAQRAAGRKAARRPPGNGVFTVLFVGRIAASKAQDDLIEAFAVFRARFGRPCRLVLVGHADLTQSDYLGRLMDRVGALGLADAVHLTGFVPDEELQDWYGQADLYVSLSRHEGFGVPLVEALAHSIPVLARPSGAVPFTLGDGVGTLLEASGPGAVADAMLEAAAGGRPANAEALARWSLDRQMPVLMTALAAAGALPPVDPATRAAAARRMHFTVAGHVAGSYSLAAVNRAVAATLEGQRPGSVRMRPVEGAATGDLAGVPDAERPLVAALAGRPAPESGPELVLSGHYPVHVPVRRGDVTAALFFWEETLVPAATVGLLNRQFDMVVAPSSFVARTLVDSGVAVPVLNLGQAPDLKAHAAPAETRDRSGPFTFLHVSSAFPRKGVDVLLAAWALAFTAADRVRLVIKAFPNPHNEAAAQCGWLRADHPGAAPVVLVDEDLPAEAMLALYREADAAVLPTRGEGYNLAAAEAMAAGLPLIVTGWGGHGDFCTADTSRLVKYRLEPSGSHLAGAHSLWAEPDVADLAAALREAAAGSLARLVAPARARIAAAADPAAFTARLADAAAAVLVALPARPLRLAWVSSWAVRCGVAEYSRTLLESLPGDLPGGLADPVILADDRTPAGPNVRPCWHVGDANSADRLAEAVARVDADVTVVQHQPGLLPWQGLTWLLERLADRGRAVIVVLHNTRHFAEDEEVDRAAAIHALGRVARIVVHTTADLRELGRHGLGATLLPHPAPSMGTAAAVRTLPPDAAPVIGCTGFFLPDKGVPELIAATALLRRRWPGVRLRLVNAEYDAGVSAELIAECRARAEALSLPVEWHTGFVTHGEQRALLAGCDLLVLPYQRSKESSSAALRSALAAGVAVAVTPLPLFAEADDAVFRMSGLEPEALAEGMAMLLSEPERRAALVADARAWLADRAAPDVGRRLGGMLAGLAAQQRLGAAPDGSLWRGSGGG